MKDNQEIKILVIAGLPDFLPDEDFDKIVGVDRGAHWAVDQGLELTMAVGDFDSVSMEEFANIQAESIIQLPAEKDLTDLEAALEEVVRRWPKARLTIIGVLGGRLDHALTNIYLPLKYKKYDMTLLDKQNKIQYLQAGAYVLRQDPNFPYIGFVQVETDRTLAISGAKYNLKAADNFADIYASNEFVGEEMTISFKKGSVLVIYSRDEK